VSCELVVNRTAGVVATLVSLAACSVVVSSCVVGDVVVSVIDIVIQLQCIYKDRIVYTNIGRASCRERV